jgi:uncharacterized protein (DUF927 family)
VMSSGGKKGRSPEEIAAEETERQTAMLKWADEIAEAVIEALVADIALPFIEGDSDDGEQSDALDLIGDYDPIVDPKTGSRLSEAIKQATQTFRTRTFRPSEEMLRKLYRRALKAKWEEHKAQNKKIPSEPAGKRYGRSPYLTNRHGVWVGLNTGGLDDLPVWRRIAKTCVEPEALSYDTTRRRNYQYRYLITGEIGQFPVDIPAEHLGKKADRAINTLVGHGVHVVESKQARQHLAQFLRYRPSKRIIRAPHTGWFEWRGHCVFVLPDEVLGATEKMNIVLDGIAVDGHGLHRVGTSDEWRQHVAAPFARNSNVVLAVGTMLAAPLLRWADEAAGGFHFCGDAKIGKTLIGALAQSVWGRPFAPGAGSDVYGYTWESTANALEERAALRNDVGLYLDEIGVGDPKAIKTAIYTLAGGLGKGRMRQRQLSFNVLILSTGEISVARILGENVRAGQRVRLADIPVAVQAGSAFEQFPAEQIAGVGRRFYAATREYHGAVGHDWLEHLVRLGPEDIKQHLNRLRDRWLAQPMVTEILTDAHPQAVSVVNRFALVAATLAMAIEAEILPWSRADTDTAIIDCMQRWRKECGNIDAAAELQREIEHRLRILAATTNDQFIRLSIEGRRLVPASAADQHKMERADEFDGYIKDGHILMTPEAWQRLWAGLSVEDVNKHLLKIGMLIPDRKGKASRVEKYTGDAPAKRFYVLTLAFIDGATA